MSGSKRHGPWVLFRGGVDSAYKTPNTVRRLLLSSMRLPGGAIHGYGPENGIYADSFLPMWREPFYRWRDVRNLP